MLDKPFMALVYYLYTFAEWNFIFTFYAQLFYNNVSLQYVMDTFVANFTQISHLHCCAYVLQKVLFIQGKLAIKWFWVKPFLNNQYYRHNIPNLISKRPFQDESKIVIIQVAERQRNKSRIKQRPLSSNQVSLHLL